MLSLSQLETQKKILFNFQPSSGLNYKSRTLDLEFSWQLCWMSYLCKTRPDPFNMALRMVGMQDNYVIGLGKDFQDFTHILQTLLSAKNHIYLSQDNFTFHANKLRRFRNSNAKCWTYNALQKCWYDWKNFIVNIFRVGKCHGYDGYIRVNKLDSWGKKFWRPK